MALEHEKIFTLEQLKGRISHLKEDEKKIVFCYGHFNLIHPGHLRFLKYAKSLGDVLIVGICSNKELVSVNRESFFSQDDRCAGIAHVEIVDFALKSDGDVKDLIKIMAPDFYVKGKEFEGQSHLIQDEIELVKEHGGKVVFSSGEIRYNLTPLASSSLDTVQKEKYSKFINSSRKHNVNFEKLKSCVSDFGKRNILVIGDTIVDEFIGCDTLGVSSEAPVMVVRELESRRFIGGAAIIAQHIASLGANCTYISVTGDDELYNYVESELAGNKVSTFLFQDKSRPTSFKIRYMVGDQKVLRVSRLKEHAVSKRIEDMIIEKLEEVIPGKDGVIISDFIYGVLTERVIDSICSIAKKHNVLVFADAQCSSQIGDVSKYKDITLITPTEKEARVSLGDKDSGLEALALNLIEKTGNENLVLTLADQGLLSYGLKKGAKEVYESEFFPALEVNPVDVAGAGDAMLTGYCLSMCSDLNLIEASVLASCMSARTIMRIGNIPLKKEEVISYIDELINFENEQQNQLI